MLDIIQHPNFPDTQSCPICGTKDDKPVVLIPILGTGQRFTFEAHQYHTDCIDLVESRVHGGMIIFQVFKEKP